MQFRSYSFSNTVTTFHRHNALMRFVLTIFLAVITLTRSTKLCQLSDHFRLRIGRVAFRSRRSTTFRSRLMSILFDYFWVDELSLCESENQYSQPEHLLILIVLGNQIHNITFVNSQRMRIEKARAKHCDGGFSTQYFQRHVQGRGSPRDRRAFLIGMECFFDLHLHYTYGSCIERVCPELELSSSTMEGRRPDVSTIFFFVDIWVCGTCTVRGCTRPPAMRVGRRDVELDLDFSLIVIGTEEAVVKGLPPGISYGSIFVSLSRAAEQKAVAKG